MPILSHIPAGFPTFYYTVVYNNTYRSQYEAVNILLKGNTYLNNAQFAISQSVASNYVSGRKNINRNLLDEIFACSSDEIIRRLKLLNLIDLSMVSNIALFVFEFGLFGSNCSLKLSGNTEQDYYIYLADYFLLCLKNTSSKQRPLNKDEKQFFTTSNLFGNTRLEHEEPLDKAVLQASPKTINLVPVLFPDLSPDPAFQFHHSQYLSQIALEPLMYYLRTQWCSSTDEITVLSGLSDEALRDFKYSVLDWTVIHICVLQSTVLGMDEHYTFFPDLPDDRPVILLHEWLKSSFGSHSSFEAKYIGDLKHKNNFFCASRTTHNVPNELERAYLIYSQSHRYGLHD